MSTTIDSRVLEMRFDNKQFESNVSTTMSTLGKLKQSLNLTGATKGLENVGVAAKGINMSGLGTAVETVAARFSALQVIGVTALANITNSAVNTGKRMLSALTIDPIKTGLSEYETQINAVQTILANTESKGTTLGQVNAALDQLNTYADKTIYNFTEMTRNIGTFTAAGVDLDTSVNAIQGIANLAAVSGSNSQQASTAMYQLSQALSSGTVRLMDWNSVVNAGMGGQVFQDALKETARVHGVAIDDMMEKNGSFRETLQEGWLTADILTETLSHFTMAAEEGSKEWNEYKKSLMDDGYTEEQANAILKLSNTATDAATKVKTATQLWDTLKETAQSGWTQTWEIILGDFGEAKELFSGMFETLSPLIEKSAEARNTLLEGAMSSNWDKMVDKINEAGVETTKFEETLKSTVKSHGIDVDKLIKDHGSLEKAFQSGAVSSDVLNEAVGKLNKGLSELQSIERNLGKGKTGEDVKKIQKALKDLDYDIGGAGIDGDFGKATEAAVKAFQEANGLKITGIVDEETIAALEKATGATEELSLSVDDLINDITKLGGRDNLILGLKNAFDGLVNIAKPIKEAFKDIFPTTTEEQVRKLYGFTENFKALTETFKNFGTKYADQIKRTFKGIFSILDIGKKIITAFGNSISDLIKSSGVSNLGDFLLNSLASIGDFFTSMNKNFDVDGVSDIFSSLAFGVSDVLGKTVEVFKDFGKILSVVGDFICDVASDIWDGVKKVFSGITEHFDISDIFAGLAGGGIFLLAKKLMGFIKQLSELFDGGLMGALFGKGGEKDGDSIKDKISDLFDGVGEALQGFTASVKVGSFVAIAAAIAILTSAFGKLAELDAVDIGKSLVTMGVSLGIMMKALNSMPTNKAFASSMFGMTETTNLIKSGISLMMLAKAMDILADAMTKLAELSWEEIGKGMVGVGGGIAALCGGLKVLNGAKVSLGTSIAMLALAEACKILGDAMQKFVGFSWDEIARGLAGMGGALGEMVAALTILSKAGGLGSVFGATGILIAVQGLSDLAESLKSFAEMSWAEIGRGLAGMGGALGELAIVLGVLSKISSISISGGIGGGILAKLGKAGASGGLAGSLSASINGLSTIFSAGAIWVVIQGLKDLSDAFKDFGSMSWSEIGAAGVAMGAALSEVAASAGILGKLAGFSSVFGAGAIWIVVQGLADLAAAFKEFGSMSWAEIDRAVVAMFDALAEVGAVSGLLGTLAGFSSILGGAAIWVTVQGLSDLATAFAQFAGMAWDEIGRGLVAMGGALLEVSVISGALGYLAGLPALLGGGAILLAVQGLGELADALKKFGEMSWDEIGRGLTAMGAALGEVALGALANTLSGLGALAIADVAAPLGILADSVKKWKDVSVPEGLGTQLSNLALGVMEFTFGGWGAGAIADVAAPLGILADSVKKWTGITVAENLGTNLETLATGVKAFTWGGMGASALSEAAPGVGAMADAVTKWSNVTVPENIGSNLESLGAGVKAFTFGGSGASSLEAAAPGVGAMADSVAKWTSVTVPEGLGTTLETLATGVKAFTFGGSGAGSLSEAAPGIGTLADSVKKWVGVEIPEGLVDQLDSLATGIKKFTFGGSGADSIATCASSLGVMADSVKKWTGVTIPDGLTTNLSTLATGVKAFTWSGNGSDNLSVAATGVGAMADAVAKWSGVTIPEGFGDNLTTLSTSIKNICGIDDISTTVSDLSNLSGQFSSLAEINYAAASEGLTTLCSSLSNFGTLTDILSGDIATTITDIGKAISEYSEKVTGIDLSAITASVTAATKLKDFIAGLAGLDVSGLENFKLKYIADRMKEYSDIVSNIDIVAVSDSISIANRLKAFIAALSRSFGVDPNVFKPEVIGAALKAYSTSIAGLDITAIGSSVMAANQLKNLISSLAGLDASGVGSFKSAIDELSSINTGKLAEAFSGMSSQMITAGVNMINGLIQGIQSMTGAAESAVTALATSAKAKLDSYSQLFTSAGTLLMTSLVSGITGSASKVLSAVQSCVLSAATHILSFYGSFYSSGGYLVSGFAAGITANTFMAAAAASAMASAAVQAARRALAINSPSKVFRSIGTSVPEGFAMGIGMLGGMITDSVDTMAETAVNGTRDAISRIADVINTDIDSQPTIRPVLDLSDITDGVNSIDGMFNMNPSIRAMSNVGAISSGMNARNQNRGNDDVITAINKLGKELGKTGGDTYQVNGVTYDDGSDIKNFAQAVIRQARIERRV